MARSLAAASVLITLLLVVAVVPESRAHTDAELERWQVEWGRRVIADGLVIEHLEAYTDMARRHPCWFRHCHQPRATARAPARVWTADVEQWRPLVETYFAADQVERALRIMACESGGVPTAKNPGSSAAGLWQFLRSTWDRVAAATGSPTYAEGGPYDPTWATVNAAWLQARGSGWNQWECY